MARAAQSRPASARAQQCLAVQQRAHPLPAAGKRTGRAMHGKGRLRQAPWVHRHRTRTRSTNLPRAGACHPRRHHQTWSMCGFRVQPPRPPRRLRAALFHESSRKKVLGQEASRTELTLDSGSSSPMPHKNGVSGTLFPDLRLVESASPYPNHELGLPNIDPNNVKGSY